ncbi:MAG: formate dehydrogenase accessory sulfurtransferase FdhD [Planctomycetota bacterium]
MPPTISEAFLLCGGESRRLGFPKEMIRADGAPLAVALVRRLQSVFERVSVVTNHPAYLDTWLDVPLWRDEYPGLGPLAGVHAGLRQVKGEGGFFLGCDMPFLRERHLRRVAQAAAEAPATVARTNGGAEPLCGVYATELLPELEERLRAGEELSTQEFLHQVDADYVDFGSSEERLFRDVDRPEDLAALRREFEEVEPLPVARHGTTRIGGETLQEDSVAVERAFDFRLNGVRMATVQCLPGDLRPLVVGFLSYLGLIDEPARVGGIDVDYEAARISARAEIADEDIQKAFQLQISSSCGAGIYGPPLSDLEAPGRRPEFRVSADRILEVVHRLRAMAPAFGRTGGTHQAAFSDPDRILQFAEDVGRHNAIDKVVGYCLIDGTDASRGFLAATGRLNAQMMIKALRQGIPVVASRSAATTGALEIAEDHGLTVVGFARGHRVNVYTHPERIAEGA